MKNIRLGVIVALLALAPPALSRAQGEKLDRIRAARASDSATEAALWFAKEGGFFEKHRLSVEFIRLQGSSLVVSTMLAGEIAISQIGAAAVVDSALAGSDLINVATIVRNFVFYIFSRPDIERMSDLKGKAMGTSRYGAISDFAARFANTDAAQLIVMLAAGPVPRRTKFFYAQKTHVRKSFFQRLHSRQVRIARDDDFHRRRIFLPRQRPQAPFQVPRVGLLGRIAHHGDHDGKLRRLGHALLHFHQRSPGTERVAHPFANRVHAQRGKN